MTAANNEAEPSAPNATDSCANNVAANNCLRHNDLVQLGALGTKSVQT